MEHEPRCGQGSVIDAFNHQVTINEILTTAGHLDATSSMVLYGVA
jgi:hypothetical protein